MDICIWNYGTSSTFLFRLATMADGQQDPTLRDNEGIPHGATCMDTLTTETGKYLGKRLSQVENEKKLHGFEENVPTNGQVVQAKSVEIMERISSGNPNVLFELTLTTDLAREDIILQNTIHRTMQHISESGLKQLLNLINKHYQDKLFSAAPLMVLHGCCSSSAVVKRVLVYPGIVKLLQAIAEDNIGVVSQWARTGQEGFHPINFITFGNVLILIGKCMPFSKQSDGLIAWWNTCITRYIDVLKAISSPGMICHLLLEVNQVKLDIENGLSRAPFEVISDLNYFASYRVFCSSLRCSRSARKDGVLPHCSRCMLARYCSRQCQKDHWKNGHKENCWKRGRWVSSMKLGY